MWSALANARWPTGPYSGIRRLKHVYGLGAGRCDTSQQLGICENVQAVVADGDTVVCVSAQFVCVWRTNGMHARVPCMYLAPHVTYKPHMALVGPLMLVVSIGSAVEFSMLTGGRAIVEVPCSNVTSVAKGPGGALVVTDFGTVWHCSCRSPGTQSERTRSSRLFTPCIIEGRTTGPATCAAYHNQTYYYGTTQGLYREGIHDAFPKCLMRGFVACVVTNSFGTAAICDDRVIIYPTGCTTQALNQWYVQPGHRLHLFRDLLMCGSCTINMRTMQISTVDACEYAVASTGTISAIRRGTRVIILRHDGGDG